MGITAEKFFKRSQCNRNYKIHFYTGEGGTNYSDLVDKKYTKKRLNDRIQRAKEVRANNPDKYGNTRW